MNNESSHLGSSSTLSLALFFGSLLWFRRKIQREPSDDFDESKSSIGPRGAAAMKLSSSASSSYWESFMLCLQNPFDPKLNPDGYISLCLAENKLVQEALAIRLMQQGTAITAFSDSCSYCLDGFLGLYSAKEAAAYFLQKRFFKRERLQGMHRVESLSALDDSSGDSGNKSIPVRDYSVIDPANIAFGAGVNSLLNQLFFILAKPDDVVLVPAPYYSAYDFDAKAIAQCKIHPVYMDNPIVGPTASDLENAARDAEKQGKRVKILLLTNPNDPLGVIYRPHVINSVIAWARERKLHTIVNEIYALSVHMSYPSRFDSTIKVLDNQMNEDVHVLWGLSKDFGASGFRFGVLYTHNAELLQSLANLNIFSAVSNPMQMIVAEVLMDDNFIDSFLERARGQLLQSYNLCIEKLQEMVVPYVAAEAGLFVYVDFSSLLPEPTFEGEAKFASLIQDFARVVMTPGQIQHDRKPGMFRLCYTWVTPDVLEVAMERLSYVVLQIRRNHWDHLLSGNWKHEVTKNSMRRSTMNLSELVGYD